MFAADRLAMRGETDAIRRRHADVYLALAERIEPSLQGRHHRAVLDRLDEDHDNFRAVIDWAVDSGEPEVAMRLAAALWRYWQGRGHIDEGWATVSRVLAMRDASEPTPGWARSMPRAAWPGGGATWRAPTVSTLEQVDLARRIGEPHELALASSNLSHSRSLRRRCLRASDCAPRHSACSSKPAMLGGRPSALDRRE